MSIVEVGLTKREPHSIRKLAYWILAAIAVVVAVWGLWAIWQKPAPNILFITLDTTRADRLGCYGYSAARTPVLDSLAEQGVVCEQAFTVAPLTLPAHASLFTGLYPAENGVRTNGRGRLDASIPTLAEVFKDHHYDTAAFIAAFVLDSKFGLARGFNTYDDDTGSYESESNAMHRHRDGEAVVDAALAWLRHPRSQAFFCWVHLYDTHAPYSAHTELFEDEFSERPYDGEIAYVDRQVGRLMEYLKQQRLVENTIVVVVGDHGEGLNEHGEETHGVMLYNSTLRVPLIFQSPNRVPAKRRITANVSLVDISSTILDLAGIGDSRRAAGKSLKPLLIGETAPVSPCIAATDDPFLFNGWSPLRSLTYEKWKYIRTTRVELYDLTADPNELQNLAESNPEQTQEMEARLGEIESQLVVRDESRIQLSPSDRRALASLGYVGAASTAHHQGTVSSKLPDIKDMMIHEIEIREANKLINEGKADEGLSRLREVVRAAPTLLEATWLLGRTLGKIGKPDEALEVFREYLVHKPDSAQGHLGMGVMLLALKRPDEAIVELRKSLEIDAESTDAHFNLAKILLTRGQIQEAMSHIDRVIELDPRHAEGYEYRAFLREQLGHTPDAIADYRRAVLYAPVSAEAHGNLGILLADNGFADEALKHLSRSVELAPQRAELHSALGRLLVRQGKLSDAIAHLTKALELKPGFAPAEEALQDARRREASGK